MASQYGYGPTAGMSPLALAAENAMVRRNRRLELSALGFAPMTSILPDPSWDAVWGGQDRAQEAANAAGYDYVADNSGLGTMPRRRTTGTLATGLNDFDRESLGYQSQAAQSNADALEGRFAQLALEEAQRAGKARQDAVEQDKLDRQAADYERFKVESAFQPPIERTRVTHTIQPGKSELITTRPEGGAVDARAVLEQQMQRLPANHPVRLDLEKRLATFDAEAAKQKAEQDKAVETKRHNVAMEGKDNTDDDVSAAIAGMREGTLPPLLPGRASKDYTKLMAEAKRQGYDLATAATDWTAAQKHFATLNGAQQTRIRQATDTAYHSLDVIDDLAKQWDGGPYPILNRAALASAKQGALGPKAQSIATQLDAQITDLTSELGNVYMGGNSPTDHALELAGKNLSANWSKDVLLEMTKLARKNLEIRRNSISNVGVIGPSAQNPYAGGGAGPAAASQSNKPADLVWDGTKFVKPGGGG